MAQATHRKRVGGLIVLAALLSAMTIWAISSANEAKAQQSALPPFAQNNVFGLVDNADSQRLVRFNQRAPQTLLSNNEITGLEDSDFLVGIDFRPSNGRLYGVAINDTNNLQIYLINFRTAAATAVGDELTQDRIVNPIDPMGTQPGTGLVITSLGEDFGVDFNPVADALRIVNDADENFRVTFDGIAPNDTVQDGTLVYEDGNTGTDPNVVATAYTNSVAGATSTTQRFIDSNLDIIGTQTSNPGLLNEDAPLTTPGGGMRDIEDRAGMDIVRGFGALVLIRPGASVGPPRLASINIESGVATDRGRIGPPVNATDIALPLPMPMDDDG